MWAGEVELGLTPPPQGRTGSRWLAQTQLQIWIRLGTTSILIRFGHEFCSNNFPSSPFFHWLEIKRGRPQVGGTIPDRLRPASLPAEFALWPRTGGARAGVRCPARGHAAPFRPAPGLRRLYLLPLPAVYAAAAERETRCPPKRGGRGSGPQGAEVPFGPGGAAGALGLPAVLPGGAPGLRAAALLQRLPLQAVLRHPRLQLPERSGRSLVWALGRPGAVLCAGLGGRHLLLPALQGLRKAVGGLLLPGEGGHAAEKGGGQQEQSLLLPALPETLPHDAQLVLELLIPDSEHPHRAVLLLGPHRPDPVQLHLCADRLHPVLRHLPGRHLLLGDRAQAAGHRPGGADPGHPHQALQPQASQAGRARRRSPGGRQEGDVTAGLGGGPGARRAASAPRLPQEGRGGLVSPAWRGRGGLSVGSPPGLWGAHLTLRDTRTDVLCICLEAPQPFLGPRWVGAGALCLPVSGAPRSPVCPGVVSLCEVTRPP